MTLGVFDNFPPNIHFVAEFHLDCPSKQLQQRLIQTLYEINRKEFSFEEAGNPTIPDCKIIFEFGLADAENFNYIDEEEVKKATESACESERLDNMDFFCAIRYYKGEGEKKTTAKI